MTTRARNESGQTLSEYSVVLAVITLATIAVFAFLSGNIISAIEQAAGIAGG